MVKSEESVESRVKAALRAVFQSDKWLPKTPSAELACSHLVVVLGHGRCGKDTACAAFSQIWPRLGPAAPTLLGVSSMSQAAVDFVSIGTGRPVADVWSSRHEDREFWKLFCDGLREAGGPLVLLHEAVRRLRSGRPANQALQAVGINGLRAFREVRELLDSNIARCEFVWIDRPGNPADPTMEYSSADYLRLASGPNPPRARFHWLTNDRGVDELNRKVEFLLRCVFTDRRPLYSTAGLSVCV